MKTDFTPLLFLVDDDEDDKSLFSMALRDFLPMAVIDLFANGKEAVAALQKQVRRLPDLIVLDLNMPVMCGFEVLSWLRSSERFRPIPVVIFSTSRSAEDMERCRQGGANDYFCKPAELDGYRAVAEKVVNQFFRKVRTAAGGGKQG